MGIELIQTTDEAREYFKYYGFTYADIKESDFYILMGFLSEELEKYSEEVKDPNTHGISTMKISGYKSLKRNLPIYENDKNGKLLKAFIKVDSHYFEAREAISFNENGFIGFAGWADSTNIKPFIKAFIYFVDYLRHKRTVNYGRY